MKVISIIVLMMEMELVYEMLDFINTLMWLYAQQTFIEFCRCENFKTYINLSTFVDKRSQHS